MFFLKTLWNSQNSICFLSPRPRKLTFTYTRPFSTSLSPSLNVLLKLLNPYQVINYFYLFLSSTLITINLKENTWIVFFLFMWSYGFQFTFLCCFSVEKSELEITRNNTLYEIAKSIKNNSTLKLPNNNEVSTLLQSELEKPLKEDSFRIDSFMNFFSTN